MTAVPDNKIEQYRDSPDGRNHVCATGPISDTVYCFQLGAGL